MEIDELFESLTIKELKQQNIKTRTEIESKKEELRFLVGERYRDIIDAADTIFEMKSCADEIAHSLKSINALNKRWNSSLPYKLSDTHDLLDKKLSEVDHKYSVAAQIKLLLNMSELIWNALENNAFSEAAMLFNISRNMVIHSQLSYEKYKSNDLDIHLIFSRQWSSLQNFEETISIVSRKYLKNYKKSNDVESILDCLMSILLLEDKNLEEVLKEYIDCIEYQIQEWFSSKSSIIQINKQLCTVSSIVMKTINIIYELFIEEKITIRIKEMAKIIVKSMDCVKGERIYQYLPEQIYKFKPALKPFQTNCDEFNHNRIICITKDWLENNRKKYQTDFASSFSHLTTIKSVGETRNELKNIFIDDRNGEISKEWQQTEFENASEWNKIIYGIYIKKLKVIIEDKISTLFTNWKNEIEKFIRTNENLISENEFNEDFFFNYFWTECNKDAYFNSESFSNSNSSDVNQTENKTIFYSLYNHFSNYFDVGPLISNKNCNFESLIIKAKNIRPEIYQITKLFNDDLMQLIVEIIDTVNDCDEFLSILLKECLSSVIKKCMSWIESIDITNISKPTAPKEILKKDKDFPNVKIESENIINAGQFKLIILSQSVRTIYETFPALQAGLMTSAVNVEQVKGIYTENKSLSKNKSKSLRLPYLPGKKLQHQSDFEFIMWNTWNDNIGVLHESVNNFVICGIRSAIFNLISQYFEHIKMSFKSVDICEYLSTKWTNLKFENTESENSLPISLSIPSQCSWLMHKLLINLSRLLTVFGGHSIARKSLDQIRLEILKIVIEQYELVKRSDEFQENKSCQKQNIQLIFDLRFFLEIINAKTGIEKEVQDKLRTILTEIGNSVDPFDYDMMNETLHQNLTLSVTKTSSLYLLLSSNLSKRSTSIAQRIETGTNQHNLIDLVGAVGNKHSKSCVRFGMLPISGYMVPSKNIIPDSSEDSNKVAPIIEPRQAIIKCAKPNLVNPVTNHNKNRSYYLGRLGSNWF